LSANQQFVLGMEPSLPRALLGGENLIIHFVTPGKMLSIWIARLRGNVRAATAYGAHVSPVTSELGFRFSYVEEAISEPLMSTSVSLILRLPEVLSGVQDFLGQDQFL
jgi:hypothetical protein